MHVPNTMPAPGSRLRFTVGSAGEAARLIQEKFGGQARVLSVRSVPPTGLRRLWASPRLEIIAEIEGAPSSPAAAAVQPEVSRIEDEISVPAPVGELGSHSPRQLRDVLRRSGFSETFLARLEQSPGWSSLNELPLHRSLIEMGRFLRGHARPHPSPLTRAAFLSTAGAGRTTALCKWLAKDVFRRGRHGHVVIADLDRPFAAGPLPVYCDALGVPVARVPASTHPSIPGGFVYVELPALSLESPAENRSLAEFLEREKIAQRVLVLNGAYSRSVLRATCAVGREVGATHVVLTHLDEVTHWGRLWEFLHDGPLIPLFLGTGPSLTGDCDEEVWESLARRTLPESDPLTIAADRSASPLSAIRAA